MVMSDQRLEVMADEIGTSRARGAWLSEGAT